jgi:thiamine pyrophosphate-dependent acetolactate synthase large subunit-like protein
VLISGDGGFMMGGLTELNTVASNRLDMIIVVCSDGSYGAEHVQFRNRSLDPRQSMFDWPDFAPVAEALGVRGVTVRNQGDLDAAVQAIAARDGPLLIDLRIDPERIAWG